MQFGRHGEAKSEDASRSTRGTGTGTAAATATAGMQVRVVVVVKHTEHCGVPPVPKQQQ